MEEFESPPSKTRRKKEMTALQDLGEALVQLAESQLAQVPMADELRDAVREARRIKSFPALRRQMQYIGRLMRVADAAPIAAKLAAWRGESAIEKARHQRLEHWRDRLIAEDAALTDWVAEHPDGDAQQLRTLIRNARKEIADGRPPHSIRALFRLLREISGAA